MEIVLVGFLTMGLAAWIVMPLLRPRTAPVRVDEGAGDLLDAKQSVYRSLVDLESDRELGRISDEDYAQLKQEGKREALELIRKLDSATPGQSEESTLEEEIRAARARLRRE